MSSCLTPYQRVYNGWILLLSATIGLIAGCGVVGPPVAPEDVGVAPIIERQKRQQAGQTHPEEQQQPYSVDPGSTGEFEQPLQGQDVDLPPLRPGDNR